MLAQDSFPPLTPIANLGIGGAIAILVFYFYRVDRRSSEERLYKQAEDCEKRYEDIAQDYKKTLQENTAAITKLCDAIDRLEDGVERKSNWTMPQQQNQTAADRR